MSRVAKTKSRRRGPTRQAVYHAKKGSPIPKADVQKVGEYIRAKLGEEVSPHDLLEDARKKKSPLHKYFEWDDTVAAEKWRLHYARNIINHIDVEVIVEGKPTTQPAYISFSSNKKDEDVEEGGFTYVSIEKVLREPDLFERHRAKLLRELRSLRNRYEDFSSILDAAILQLEAA